MLDAERNFCTRSISVRGRNGSMKTDASWATLTEIDGTAGGHLRGHWVYWRWMTTANDEISSVFPGSKERV